MTALLRPLSLVKLHPRGAASATSAELPFMHDMPLAFFGEIPNMPEHGVFAGHRSGRIYAGFHMSQFVELTDEEV